MRRIRSIAVFLLAIVGAVQVVVTVTPVLSWWTRYLTGPAWDSPAGDVLIVLAGERDHPGGVLAASTYWRSYAAVLAWREGRYNAVIVSGRGSAPSMARFLAAE